MIGVTAPSRHERVAAGLLAALLLMTPFLHSGALFEPFTLLKEIALSAAALLLTGLAILTRLTGGEGRRLSSPALPLALATAACAALSLAPAANRGLVLIGFARIAAGVALFWSVGRFIRTAEAASLLLRATLVAAALVSLGTLLQIFSPGLNLSLAGFSILPPSRAGATLGDAGLAVQFLIIALPAGIGAAAQSTGGRRLFWGGCLGLVAGALLFAGRPEGWIAAAFCLALVVATRVLQVALGDRQWARLAPDLAGESLRTLLVALVVVLGIVAVSRVPGLFATEGPSSPLDGVSLLAPTTGEAAADRAAAIRGSLALLRRHPAGIGAGAWRHAFLEVAWTSINRSPFTLTHQAIHAGNDFLERASEIGVLGGLVFVLLVLLLLVQAGLAAARAPRPWGTFGYVALNVVASACVAAFFGEPFEEPAAALLFWVLGGLAPVALSQAGDPPAPLRRLWASERPIAARPEGRRFDRASAALWLGAGLWIATAAVLGAWTWERLKASTLAQSGLGSFYARQYRQALQAFDQPASRRSPDPLPRVWAGECSLRLGQDEHSAREFGEALRLSPWFVDAHLGRAAAYQSAGRYDLAQDDLEAALRIWPDNLDTHLALARLSATRGRLDEALEEYRRITSMNSGLAEPYFRMGQIFTRRGQIDEAIEAFRVCGMKNPRYPRLQINTGDAFFRKGLLEMALRAYQAAATADDRDVEARLKIATTQHALSKFCDAKDALEAARDLETDRARRESILELIKKVEPDCAKEKKPKKSGGRP